MFEKTAKAIDEATANFIDTYLKDVMAKVISTATSVKFWLTVITMIVAFSHGGLDGLLTGLGAAGIYVGAKSYQNVQFAKNGR